jgi:hypothetical protein
MPGSRAGYTSACPGIGRPEAGYEPAVALILFLIAAALVIYGIVRIVQGEVLFGILLIVVGCLVGPGGYSVFGVLTPV